MAKCYIAPLREPGTVEGRTALLRTRTIWTMAGLAWGLLVGLAGALQTAAFLAGVGWLFVFGDDRWPDAAGWVILGLAILAGLLPILLLGWLGRRLGVAFESETRQRLRARRRGWFVLVLALSALALGGFAGWAGSLEDQARRADRRAALEQFAALSAAVPKIVEIRPPPPAEPLVFEILITGERAGEALLDWQVVERGEALAAGALTMNLQPGAQRRTVELPLEDLAAEYGRRFVEPGQPVEVDASWRFTVELRPVLKPSEAARLPEEEVHNLGLGVSSLISEASIRFPVSFRLP